MKLYCDNDYALVSLTQEEEAKKGKIELDNILNGNKRKRNLNSLLVEQRIQGAYTIIRYISTDSKNLIDSWLRRNRTSKQQLSMLPEN